MQTFIYHHSYVNREYIKGQSKINLTLTPIIFFDVYLVINELLYTRMIAVVLKSA